MSQLQDQVAVITGGTSGIGRKIAIEFGKEGASVSILSIDENPDLSQQSSVFTELEKLDVDTEYYHTDVRENDDVKTAIGKTNKRFGGIDILVNSAGIYHRASIEECTMDECLNIIDINLMGTLRCAKAATPLLRESSNANIINLSSVAGSRPTANSSAYCASKGGVNMLTRQLALDLAEDNIAVNALAPGYIRTPQNEQWHESNPELIEQWRDSTPWPRDGTPTDVARAAVFLASENSSFVTGEILNVDGGSGL